MKGESMRDERGEYEGREFNEEGEREGQIH